MEAWLLEILKEGGSLAIAAVSLWMLNRVWADRLKEAERNTETEKEQKEEYRALAQQLQRVIEENTKVIATFLERTKPNSTRGAK